MKNIFALLFLFSSAPALAEELKVLTWNVFMIHKPINWTMQNKRSKVIAEKLSTATHDILFFQELFIANSREIITNKLSKIYPYSARPSKVKFWTPLDSGLLIMSKHPLEIIDQVVYKNCTNTDCFSSKAALLVEVTTPDGKKAQFLNTHLQAWDNASSISVRNKQLNEIKIMLAKYKRPEVPQFLIGDLNIDGNLPTEFNTSLDLLEMNPGLLSGELQTTNGFKVDCYKTPGGEGHGEWLDHLWINRDANAQIISSTVVPMKGILKGQECALSDHHAVESVISL